MLATQGKLLPFRVQSEHEKITWYSLNGSGMNGLFVALETGNQNPADADGYTSAGVGLIPQGVYAPLYENKRKVRATTAGDTKYNTLGVTLQITSNTDEQGRDIRLMAFDHRDEIGYVVSGDSVPVLSRGILTLRSDAYVGTPIPGYVGIITGEGKVAVVDPSTLLNTTGAFTDFRDRIAGKFISSSGSAFGGYAQFKLEL